MTLALVAAGMACGGDGGTNPPAPVVTTIVKQTTTDEQTATVASNVPLAPSVIVRDQDGDAMPGVTVTFTVTEGGGSVTGATAESNASGLATIGSWTLGTSMGENTLVASAGGKSVTFTATGTPDDPSAVERVEGTDGQTATAGSAVPLPPAVRVADSYGNPIEGVDVTFAVTSDLGSITGGTQSTNASGIATVGSWTLGTTVGENQLSASMTGLDPVTFTATATAGEAASLTVVAESDEQIGAAEESLPVDPAVVVADAHGNPVAGVTVTFAIAAGGGSITDSVQVSDASGVATVGSWTLGPYNDINQLTASANGLDPVTFLSAPDGCTVSPTLDVGESFDGELTEWDCLYDNNRYYDAYTTAHDGATALQVTVNSTAFDPRAHLFDADGWTRAFDVGAAGDGTGSVRVIAPAGFYQPGATSVVESTLGAYTIAVSTASTNVTGCSRPWVVRGVTTTQSLTTSDCVESSGPWYSDEYLIWLRAGETLTLTMTASTMNAYLQIFNGDGTLIDADDSSAGGTNARLTFTATTTGAHIFVASAYTAQTGAYTLQIMP